MPDSFRSRSCYRNGNFRSEYPVLSARTARSTSTVLSTVTARSLFPVLSCCTARSAISVPSSHTARSALRYSPDPRLAFDVRYSLTYPTHSQLAVLLRRTVRFSYTMLSSGAARSLHAVLFIQAARSALRYSPDPRLALFIRYFLHSEAHSFTIGTIFCHGSLLLHDAFQWCGSLPPIGTLPQTGSLSSCGALYSDGSLSSCGALYLRDSLLHSGTFLPHDLLF